jgi:hypothetical protein
MLNLEQLVPFCNCGCRYSNLGAAGKTDPRSFLPLELQVLREAEIRL